MRPDTIDVMVERTFSFIFLKALLTCFPRGWRLSSSLALGFISGCWCTSCFLYCSYIQQSIVSITFCYLNSLDKWWALDGMILESSTHKRIWATSPIRLSPQAAYRLILCRSPILRVVTHTIVLFTRWYVLGTSLQCMHFKHLAWSSEAC